MLHYLVTEQLFRCGRKRILRNLRQQFRNSGLQQALARLNLPGKAMVS